MALAALHIKRAAFALLFLLLGACARGPEPHSILRGETMGTWYSVTVVADLNEAEEKALHTEIDRLLAILNKIASTYDPESELSLFNAAPAGEWLEVSAPLYEMFLTSQEISWLSSGAWDPTVGPLVRLWGFGPRAADDDGSDAVPGPDEIKRAMANVGFQNISIDVVESRIEKKADVEIDFSGIAKGYAVDELSSWLKHRGFNHHLVEIGGEIVVSGLSPRKDSWRIAVESPEGADPAQRSTINLDGVAVATSGDYRNYFEAGGRRYSHTIDPRTGSPVTHALASVTVIADSCAYADALATALSVLGPEQALQVAERHAIAAMLIVRRDAGYETIHSATFSKYLD